MIYAQFFHESTGYVPGTIPPQFDDARKELIEVCGDRGVIVIDGRMSSENIGKIAASECLKRGFKAWQIFRGETFTRAKAVSGKWRVYGSPADNSAASAYFGA